MLGRAGQLLKMENCRRRLQSPNFSVLRAIGDWSRLLQLARLQQLIGREMLGLSLDSSTWQKPAGGKDVSGERREPPEPFLASCSRCTVIGVQAPLSVKSRVTQETRLHQTVGFPIRQEVVLSSLTTTFAACITSGPFGGHGDYASGLVRSQQKVGAAHYATVFPLSLGIPTRSQQKTMLAEPL
jgi:hypothetical protein